MNKVKLKEKGIILGLWGAIWLNVLVVTFIITIMINSTVSFIPEPQNVTFNFLRYSVILSCIYTMFNLIITIIRLFVTKKSSLIILIVDIAAVLLCFLVGTKHDNRIIWSFLCCIYYLFQINYFVTVLNSQKSNFAIRSALGYGTISFVIMMSVIYIKIPWYRLFITIDAFVFVFLWLLSCFWIKQKTNNEDV